MFVIMKKFFLVVVAVLFAFTANAQIVSSTSRSISTSTEKANGWSELTFDVGFQSMYFTEDDDDSESFTGLSLNYAKAIGLSSKIPLFIRPGIGVQYSFGDMYDVDFNNLAITPKCDIGYLFNIPNSSVGLFPYFGITSRVNVLGSLSYEGESINIYDDDEMDGDAANRFQLGWRIGIDAHLSNFIVGFDYGNDFMEFSDYTKLKAFTVKVGFRF